MAKIAKWLIEFAAVTLVELVASEIVEPPPGNCRSKHFNDSVNQELTAFNPLQIAGEPKPCEIREK